MGCWLGMNYHCEEECNDDVAIPLLVVRRAARLLLRHPTDRNDK